MIESHSPLLKMLERTRGAHSRGSHSSCGRFMETDGYMEQEGPEPGAKEMTYDHCQHRRALVVENGFLVACVG